MKPYLPAIVACGLLASASSFAQSPQSSSASRQQEHGQPQQGPLSPRYIKQIQARLHQEGYYDGKVTGQWDQDTADALQNLQDAEGLESTGELDGGTIGLLFPSEEEQQAGPRLAWYPAYPPVWRSPGLGHAVVRSPAAASGSSTPNSDSYAAPSISPAQVQRIFTDAYEAGYRQGIEQGLHLQLGQQARQQSSAGTAAPPR